MIEDLWGNRWATSNGGSDEPELSPLEEHRWAVRSARELYRFTCPIRECETIIESPKLGSLSDAGGIHLFHMHERDELITYIMDLPYAIEKTYSIDGE